MTGSEVKFLKWLDVLRLYLHAKRGRCSALARHLGTRRQNVQRWFIYRHTAIPAWAAVCTNVWYWSVVSPQADNSTPAQTTLALDCRSESTSAKKSEKIPPARERQPKL